MPKRGGGDAASEAKRRRLDAQVAEARRTLAQLEAELAEAGGPLTADESKEDVGNVAATAERVMRPVYDANVRKAVADAAANKYIKEGTRSVGAALEKCEVAFEEVVPDGPVQESRWSGVRATVDGVRVVFLSQTCELPFQGTFNYARLSVGPASADHPGLVLRAGDKVGTGHFKAKRPAPERNPDAYLRAYEAPGAVLTAFYDQGENAKPPQREPKAEELAAVRGLLREGSALRELDDDTLVVALSVVASLASEGDSHKKLHGPSYELDKHASFSQEAMCLLNVEV